MTMSGGMWRQDFTARGWPTSGQGKPTLAVRTPLNAMQGRLSPDGRGLADAPDESGRWQVYAASSR